MQDLLKSIPWHIKASWGISEITKDKSSVKFNVNGKKYKGQIVISQEKTKGQLQVTFGDKTVNCLQKALCTTLDGIIEK